MRINLTAAVGIAAGSIGLIAGARIPKPSPDLRHGGGDWNDQGGSSDEALRRKGGCLDDGMGV